MHHPSDWRVIVSSRSGGGKAAQEWPRIERLLTDRNITFSVEFTSHAYHAISLARDAVLSGFRRLLVIGGDGAIHEVLNGIYSQTEVNPSEVTVGLIPVGSGNDWARLHRIPHDGEKAAGLIAEAEARTRMQDVARVDTMMDGKPYSRYMMNVGGLGFDAEVIRRFDLAKAKGHAGDKQYLKSLVSGFFSYRMLKFRVAVDGQEFFRGPALSVALGIGKYCGGGMMQTPDAVPDDGLIDLTVVRAINKMKFLFKVPSLKSGKIFRNKEVIHTRGTSVEISATPRSYMEVDGETVGITPVHVTLIPAGIRVVSNL